MKKYSIHYTFILFLIMSLLIGLVKEVSFVILGLFLHELGHLCFIKLFKHNINKITLYPFGGVIIYENKNDFIYKAFLISMGGICSNFLFYFLFKILKLYSLANINLLFLMINLIPIYPLDGGRIMILSLSLFLPYKLSKSLVHYFSIFLSVLLISLLINKFGGIYLYFLIVFFIKSNVSSLIMLKKDHQMFLLLKHLNPNHKLKRKETKFWCNNPINCLFMGRNTVFDFETFKVEEKDILKNHFKKKKRL